jgi:hypothetical protein
MRGEGMRDSEGQVRAGLDGARLGKADGKGRGVHVFEIRAGQEVL